MIELSEIRRYIDDPNAAAAWFRQLNIVNSARAHGNLQAIATCGVPLDLIAVLFGQLQQVLGASADPDMALNNLERFITGARSPLSIAALFERDAMALPTLIQIFSTSQHLSDLLIADPESFELVRETRGRPVARDVMIDQLVAEVAAMEHEPAVMRALRRFKQRETLRIAYGDIIHCHSLRNVTQQISHLADAEIEAALHAAWRKTSEKRGMPIGADGAPARFVVLALGKLGGEELNYSSDIDLIFLYDLEGQTAHRRPVSNAEFFAQLGRETSRFLSETHEIGSGYRVDLRLRPNGSQGTLAIGYDAAIQYYENRGRTWERQAMIKARPCAGDLSLGREFLDQLTPWIYRRYLNRADITGIKALKRRIEHRAIREGDDQRNVKTGRGGIRDIEFVIQFLQLLNGGDVPEIRTGNTLEAISQLERTGCLSHQESDVLEDTYTFLRRAEHLLQIMCDLQTHVLPEEPDELRKLAIRMGYGPNGEQTPLDAFTSDYQEKTQINRRILDHLLHDAFGAEEEEVAAEVDLVLAPDPSPEQIEETLGKYAFQDVGQVYKHLMALGEEKIRFLSTRRCRHFLAAIAPDLLALISATPDPDATLLHLGQVADSLGGKGVLWELFNFNYPSQELYVRLCAYAPYLCGILTSNPGMIDGLMDSLVLDKLPSLELMQRTLADLCRGAEDIEPILHSFKNDQQLRVGVRDVLGKSDIRKTTGTLADIAQTCLEQITSEEYRKLASKLGEPTVGEGPRSGEVAELAIVGMGKFGGRELNYHSDLDIVFLFEADGATRKQGFTAATGTTNQHFYGELGQRIMKRISQLGPYGRLYEVDARLRPTGKSGPLATSLDAFLTYFDTGAGALWERQALCRSRVVYGSPRMTKITRQALDTATFERRWLKGFAADIRDMRRRLEETATGKQDLKRGRGGMVDVEFIVQLLQLRFGRRNRKVRNPNTLDALHDLNQAGYLADEDYDALQRGYRLLRTIESRLKLTNHSTTSRLPEDPTELAKLAHLVPRANAGELLVEFESTLDDIRARFDRIFTENGA